MWYAGPLYCRCFLMGTVMIHNVLFLFFPPGAVLLTFSARLLLRLNWQGGIEQLAEIVSASTWNSCKHEYGPYAGVHTDPKEDNTMDLFEIRPLERLKASQRTKISCRPRYLVDRPKGLTFYRNRRQDFDSQVSIFAIRYIKLYQVFATYC